MLWVGHSHYNFCRGIVAVYDPVTSSPDAVDRVWRLAFWVYYRLARQVWRFRHPLHHGAVVAIWHDGRIMGVTQTYTDTLTWPGGGIRTGEDAREAAKRELREELGLIVDSNDLRLVDEMTSEWEYRRDHVKIFELQLKEIPRLVPDGREISRAEFMLPRDMLSTRTPPFVPVYLWKCESRWAAKVSS